MPLDPARRSLRLLAVLGAFAVLPFLAACDNTREGDDDDDDDDDSMGAMNRPVAALVVTH